MSALLPKVAIDKGATSGAVEVIKRKDIRALFCARGLIGKPRRQTDFTPRRQQIKDTLLSIARAASGRAVTESTLTLMKSRRRIAFPEAGTTPIRTRLRQEFAIKKWGVGIKLHSSNREARMSALGQDIDDRSGDVRFTPKADIGFGSDYAFGAAAPAAWRYSQQSFAPRLSDI